MAREVNVSSFQESEWEVILPVLYRDRAVQKVEEERIRKLKTHLQHLRWKGAKSAGQEYSEKSCARCQRGLGLLLNRGAVCQGCSHRVCSACRVFPSSGPVWRCTVCYEGRNVRIKTGEWFFEERAKKFPTEGRHETAGAKLLQSYQKLSKISVVPPTPPPLSESWCSSPGRKVSAPDILISLNPESPKHPTDPVLKQGLLSHPTPSPSFSGGSRQGSLISINSTCTEMGNFDNANVTGEIELALRYCFKTHSLEVCIESCKNLAYGEEKKKKCNPYVKTYLLPDRSSQGKRKTGVQKNTVDPTFQETLKYQVEPTQLATRRLQVSVWHLGTLARRVFLGEVIIPLATWDFEDSATQSFRWHPLRAKAEKYEDSISPNPGELTVRAKFVFPAGPDRLQAAQGGGEPPCTGQLCLVVLGAKNLPVRSGGTLNSFVKGCLTLPDKQPLRLRSPVLKKQVCPQWKHSFVFDGVTPAQLRQSSLELTVWDKATFGVNDRLLGEARLGSEEDPAGGTGPGAPSKLQWQKVLSSPNLWTDMTLILH
ncbi:synaptotagmin-like protein 3 isoform X1 [Pteronotus mesoamericanus]|uniref:synaptotagmin-like protein 3 isoform X1 n=1 Tax=Pteronotus mesoamericanus TaxID=1884717 RepID=UPI0023EB2941|nr:synaptotagmin-like protein 3 isoform X1 [Pteronotus parnellii mesoamericanus]